MIPLRSLSQSTKSKVLPKSMRPYAHAADIRSIGSPRLFRENSVSGHQGRATRNTEAPRIGRWRPGEVLPKGLRLPVLQWAWEWCRWILRPFVLSAGQFLLLLLLQDDLTQLLSLRGRRKQH